VVCVSRPGHSNDDGYCLGAPILARIGFTMSLFIAMLAFDETVPINAAKSGILAGSFLGEVVGAIVLRIASGFHNGE
jgi:NhaA family Na+:H+ antiporter